MSDRAGTLYLVPNALDFGMAATAPLDEVLPSGVLRIAARLDHWIAENAKTTRLFLKRVDQVETLAQPLQQIRIVELPRPAKGGRPSTVPSVAPLLAPLLAGHDVGLISEAGLPGVADPGSELVAAAHAAGIPVVPLPGASALLLALAASGLHGQSFAFVGYLPVDAAQRATRIRELEAASRRGVQTQLMIETPYRNPVLLDALLANLAPATRLSVSCAVATPAGFTRSDTVARWRENPTALPPDRPAVFALLAG